MRCFRPAVDRILQDTLLRNAVLVFSFITIAVLGKEQPQLAMPLTFSPCWIWSSFALVTIFSTISALSVPIADLLEYQHARSVNQTIGIQKVVPSSQIIHSFAKPAFTPLNRTALTEHFTYHKIKVYLTETTLLIRQDDDEELNLFQRDNLLETALVYYRYRLTTHGDGRLELRDAEYYLISLPTRETKLELSAGGSELTYEIAYDALQGIEMFFHNYPNNRGAIVAVITNPTISEIDPATGKLEPVGYIIIARQEDSFATTT